MEYGVCFNSLIIYIHLSKLRYHISYPYETTTKNVVLHILDFSVLGSKQDEMNHEHQSYLFLMLVTINMAGLAHFGVPKLYQV
jgi:hypothetical protein